MQIKIRDRSAKMKPSQCYVLCMYMYPSTISMASITLYLALCQCMHVPREAVSEENTSLMHVHNMNEIIILGSVMSGVY